VNSCPSLPIILEAMQGILNIMREHHVLIKDAHIWRTTPPVQGQIHSLPTTRGKLLATNGMLCLILLPTGDVFFGHLDFFEADPKDRVRLVKAGIVKEPSPKFDDSRYDDV
jgi:hypothetical protein